MEYWENGIFKSSVYLSYIIQDWGNRCSSQKSIIKHELSMCLGHLQPLFPSLTERRQNRTSRTKWLRCALPGPQLTTLQCSWGSNDAASRYSCRNRAPWSSQTPQGAFPLFSTLNRMRKKKSHGWFFFNSTKLRISKTTLDNMKNGNNGNGPNWIQTCLSLQQDRLLNFSDNVFSYVWWTYT